LLSAFIHKQTTLKPQQAAHETLFSFAFSKKSSLFRNHIDRMHSSLALSNERAQAVRSVLTSTGVKDDRILVFPFGESQPIASNATAQGRQQNRRVELKIDVPAEDAKKMG
jgi:hypothetical protein